MGYHGFPTPSTRWSNPYVVFVIDLLKKPLLTFYLVSKKRFDFIMGGR